MIVDLRRTGASAAFAPVDDAVMGGRSWSRLEDGPDGAVFGGVVSLEDGGGFASVRSAPLALDLSGGSGLTLRVRGDGRRYKLNLRTDAALDGVTWQAPFAPAARVWEDVTLPFAAFEPRWRGRPVPEAGALEPARVTTLGLLVSDRQAGPFRLEVAWIALCRRPANRDGGGGAEG